MNPVGFAIRKPVTVMVGVILVSLFGLIALFSLPIQLTPDVDKPVVSVTTTWEGASPQEVEKEIIEEQEEKLKSLSGLKKMTSQAIRDVGTVTLEFHVGSDINRSLLDTSEKLRQVPSYPENVDEPTISAGDVDAASAIAWMVMTSRDHARVDPERVPEYRTFMEEKVKPVLERAEGIATIGVFGGMEQEVQIKVDPAKLAARKLTLLDVRNAIRRRNIDVSAGTLEEGKRSFTVRTLGKFQSFSEIEGLVLARTEGRTVYLRDVAEVELGYKEPRNIVRSAGEPSIAVYATRETGTNVITVMANLQEALQEVNTSLLHPRGLQLDQVYDQTTYIYSAIDLVFQNLYVGGILAILVLLLFLRNSRSTLVVAIAIPVSVIGSMLALTLLGRNINVVSLAGFAFAVGMVVDNSIVVMENIYRHRQMGKGLFDAAYHGTQEVWGAVLASTLTTLAVFIPVVFVQEEAGQLFRDIAIAISAAVFLSLVVSVLFIPMASARLVKKVKAAGDVPRDGLARAGRGFAEAIANLVGSINRSVTRRLATVIGLTVASLAVSWFFFPPMSYLPQGNQNLVIGFLIPPPGYDNSEFVRMAKSIEARMAPYWKVRKGEALTEEEKFPPWYQGEDPIPGITNFFYVGFGQTVFMGAMSDSDSNVKPLEALFNYAASDVPGVYVFASQTSLFDAGLASGNAIDIEIMGPELSELQMVAGMMMGQIFAKVGPARPEPSNFNLGAPEVQVLMDEEKAADLGLNVADLGFMVQSMVDGAIVSDYRHEGVNIDVKLVPAVDKGDLATKFRQIPLFTPARRQVPLSAVARIVETTAQDEIRHIEERRAIKLIATAPEGMELTRAMDTIREDIIAPMQEQGMIPPSVMVRMAGTADKLVSTREALQWNFLLAVVITYLLLASLFESFLYPLVILFSVPLAAVGGILGLRGVQLFSNMQLDILTMLGFVILVGTVVNNAILIVHQALNNIRQGGMASDRAIIESVRTRVRPIFMSASTSVFGMIPLVVFPGAGSELYRGLGSVVIGGLIASTIFTLFVVPTLFSLVMEFRKGKEGPQNEEIIRFTETAGPV